MVQASAEALVVGGYFKNNTNSGSGGAISLVYASAFVLSTHFEANYASMTGGAISIDSPTQGALKLVGCSFIDNSAGQHGGAVAVNGPVKVQMTTTNFQNNTAAFDGGAVLLTSMSSSRWLVSKLL